MNKLQLDELYHNLRELYLTDDIPQKEAVMGIVSHLTQPPGDYAGLLRFLNYYGEDYILPPALNLLSFSGNLFTRVVELGAGFGWLGRGISNAFNVPPIFVDKRQYTLIDIVADIETKNGAKRVLDELEEGDLIVMSELLHCLDEPGKVLKPFSKWPMLVVEYFPESTSYRTSYNAQVGRFGCKTITSIRSVFPGSKIITGSTDTHGIWLVLPI